MLRKDGVTLADTPEVRTIRAAVGAAYAVQGQVPTITSSFREGDALGHGRGHAEDYRTRHLPTGLVFTIASDASRTAGYLYQFIIEDGRRRWYYRNGKFEGYRADMPEAASHLHGEYDGGM
jgi:hypothetical protein